MNTIEATKSNIADLSMRLDLFFKTKSIFLSAQPPALLTPPSIINLYEFAYQIFIVCAKQPIYRNTDKLIKTTAWLSLNSTWYIYTLSCCCTETQRMMLKHTNKLGISDSFYRFHKLSKISYTKFMSYIVKTILTELIFSRAHPRIKNCIETICGIKTSSLLRCTKKSDSEYVYRPKITSI